MNHMVCIPMWAAVLIVVSAAGTILRLLYESHKNAMTAARHKFVNSILVGHARGEEVSDDLAYCIGIRDRDVVGMADHKADLQGQDQGPPNRRN